MSVELLYNTETIDRLVLVGLARSQNDTGEVRTVRCVGEVLCLQTYGRAVRECAAICTLIAACIVGSIELHARFGGIALQCAAALRVGDSGSEAQLAFLALVQHVVVVVAFTELYLLVVGIDVLAESSADGSQTVCLPPSESHPWG